MLGENVRVLGLAGCGPIQMHKNLRMKPQMQLQQSLAREERSGLISIFESRREGKAGQRVGFVDPADLGESTGFVPFHRKP